MRWGLLPALRQGSEAIPDPHQRPLGGGAREAVVPPRHALRRCLVPADGFYEWTGPKGKRRPFEAIEMHPNINDSKLDEPGI